MVAGMSPDDAAADPLGSETTSWRDLAVARSLDPARARAEKRVQRFLDAALELMSSSDNKDFTVQQVVERSGQSLRSFYQYFTGKYELMLALFEESVRSTAVHLEQQIANEDDTIARLRIFLLEYYRLCTPPAPGKRAPKTTPNPLAIAEFAQQLLTAHPKEAAQAFRPLVALLQQVLDDAAADGALRPDLDHQRIAGVLLQAVMFNAFASTISGSSVRDGSDEALWDLALHGLAP
jgi:AcrR family transcriptional regulator